MSKELKVTLIFAAIWMILLLVVIETKSRVGYLGLPLAGLAFIGYLIYLTLKSCGKLRPVDNENKETNTVEE